MVDVTDDLGLTDKRTFDLRATIQFKRGWKVRGSFTPFDYKGAEVRCGASVGVSLYPDHARDPAALLASADEAMYRVKNAG